MKRIIHFFIILTLVVPSHIPRADAGIGADIRNCAVSIGRLAKNIWQSPETPRVRFKLNGFVEILTYSCGPYAVAMRLVSRRKIGLGKREAFVETFRHDRKYIIGYTALFHLLSTLHWNYFAISMQEFEEKSQPSMNQKPDKVLMIQSMPEGDRLKEFGRYYFNRHYRHLSGSKFVSDADFDRLLEKLQQIPPGTEFDRIEVFMHGRNGKITTGDETAIDGEKLQKLKDANLCLAAKGADVRFIVCSLVRGSLFEKDDYSYQRKVIGAIAPKSRQGIAATRNIVVGHSLNPEWKPEPPLIYKIIVHALGLGVYVESEILFNLQRNYSQSRLGVVTIEAQKKSGSESP